MKTNQPPFIDLSPLQSRSAKVLLLAAGLAAFGLYTPVFFLVSDCTNLSVKIFSLSIVLYKYMYIFIYVCITYL